MHPLSDKDLDRLSREAAEQCDVDQSPSGWEALESRLDKELPVEQDKRRRRFLWIFFLFLLLSGSSLVWLLADQKDNNADGSQPKTAETFTGTDISNADKNNKPSEGDNDNIKKESDPVSVKDPERSAANKQAPPVTEDVPKNSTAVELTKEDEPISSVATKKENKPAANAITAKPFTGTRSDKTISSPIKANTKNPRITADRVIAKSNPNKQISSKPGKKPTVEERGISIPVPSRADELAGSDKVDQTDTSAKLVKEKNSDETATKIANATSLNDRKSDTAATTPLSVAREEAKQKAHKKEKQERPWAFGLVTGVDWSRINGTGDRRAGYNYGATVSYNLGKRWSVNTGFIITQKNYSALAKDFTPPKHYWTYYVDLKSLEGNCNMWDIPLNVRYNLSIKPSNTWFVNAGVTSYIMRKQAYTYDYLYNGVPTTSNWKTSSQQNDWFKIINLSLGYERLLNKSWSLQAEPFMKLPLSGVGFGQLDMASYGLLVGLRYKPLFNRAKTTSSSKIP